MFANVAGWGRALPTEATVETPPLVSAAVLVAIILASAYVLSRRIPCRRGGDVMSDPGCRHRTSVQVVRQVIGLNDSL